jgi:small-conductance mechanosensitive channel
VTTLLLSLVLAAAPVPEAAPPVELELANRTILTLRATTSGITPAIRATAIQGRLSELASHAPAGEVGTREIENGYLITIGGEAAFRIFREDVDPLSDDTLEAVRDRTVANLSTALAEIAEARSVPRLLRAIGVSVIATALLVTFLFLLGRLAAWVRPRLEAAGRKSIMRAGSAELADQTLGHLRGLLKMLIVAAGWTAAAVATYAWLVAVLEAFPYTRSWGEALGSHLSGALGDLAKDIGRGLPGLIVVAIILVGTRWLTGVVRRIFDAVEGGRLELRGLHPDTIPATRRIASVLLWLFAIAVAYPFVPGAQSTAFQGVTVFAGLMITIGSGAFVGHVLAGYMIIYSRVFRVGDYVRIGDTEGTVGAIGMFTTKVETLRREIMSIPHSVVFSAPVTNYSLGAEGSGIIVQTAITIGYGAPWRQVEALLLEAASKTPGLERELAPFVRQRALADFYVEYVLNAFVREPQTRIAVLSALHAQIQDAFNAAGVQIMSPHYEKDPAEPVVVPKSRWNPGAGQEKA